MEKEKKYIYIFTEFYLDKMWISKHSEPFLVWIMNGVKLVSARSDLTVFCQNQALKAQDLICQKFFVFSI